MRCDRPKPHPSGSLSDSHPPWVWSRTGNRRVQDHRSRECSPGYRIQPRVKTLEGLWERRTGRRGTTGVDDVVASRVALHLVVLDASNRDVEVGVVVQVDAVHAERRVQGISVPDTRLVDVQGVPVEAAGVAPKVVPLSEPSEIVQFTLAQLDSFTAPSRNASHACARSGKSGETAGAGVRHPDRDLLVPDPTRDAHGG